MKLLLYDYSSVGLRAEAITSVAQQLTPEVDRVRSAQQDGHNSIYAALYACYDTDFVQQVSDLVIQKRKLNPTMLIVIGIGGSHLAIQAVHEALHGLYYNQTASMPVYFVDTLDSSYQQEVLTLLHAALQHGQQVLITIISKSGSTLETVMSAQVFIAVLRHYCADMRSHIVVITDKDSPLHLQAQQEQWDCLLIPTEIGGRYSVFSAVGLFPLALLDVDIAQLCQGAQEMMQNCLSDDLLNNRAVCAAAIQVLHYTDHRYIHDLFLFSKWLFCIGLWYRQLIAESLGKTDRQQQPVGIMPTVSIGSSDLHSMVQLYLAGPAQVRFTTFVTIAHAQNDITVSWRHTQRMMSSVLGAIAQGTMRAYRLQKLPYAHSIFPELSAYYIGQFLQWQMVQTVYIGYLLHVNPFDQPHVELYKRETQRILADE